ncbi:MAG TPA: response regulator transcription factor [Isosphaeraceae bacterium]|jgi:DNA-binding NarL/FixJ family response regulator|nr:response regulator transcription factor [Isosphaeraceae bacterium]
MTTILLADDHHVVRQGLRALLEAEPGFSIAGEAADGLQAADLVERLKPDVLVVDLMMPGLNGLEVTRQVSKRSPQTRVILLSMHANEGYVLEALRHGATAYVLKDCTAAELVRAVHEVICGRRYLSPPLSERAIESYLLKAEETPLDIYNTLTGREREVLQLAAEGHSNAEISARLFISPRTVEIHRANLMRKLGLRNQTDLIRFALRRGIVPLEG